MLNDLLAKNQSSDKLFVEDVFSTYLYTGTGSSQTITTGVDLSANSGMVWIKGRSGATDHAIYDTVRGVQKDLVTNTTGAQTTQSTGLTAFSSTGFTIGALAKLNTNAATYVSWTFRKAPKFFDVVTYTGNATDNRKIAHSLETTPGMIIVKDYSGTGAGQNWRVWHRSANAGSGDGNAFLTLNLTNAANADNGLLWGDGSSYIAPTSTEFTISGQTSVNGNGIQFVAYLFAHDDTADGVIQCGSFTTDGSGNATVNLGWEPQWVVVKDVDGGNWGIEDTMRGLVTTPTMGNALRANLLNAESGLGGGYTAINATGFSTTAALPASKTYIYLAIRRGPMRKPTDATKVFAPVTYTGNGATGNTARTLTVGFPADLGTLWMRSGSQDYWLDKLRRTTASLATTSTGAESVATGYFYNDFSNTTATIQDVTGTNFNASGTNYISYFLRRAPAFFDITCYSGTGSSRTVSHNLGVAPELMIVKRRDTTGDWQVYAGAAGEYLVLNSTAAKVTSNTDRWNNTAPTSTVFSLGTNAAVNASGGTYVAYLFATCAGVSKIGSYTGTGTTKQIDCGFTNGARFVLIKRTDSTGDWYVYDTARGIVAGNDPYLFLNSTAAEDASTDYVDAYSAGFELSSTAPAALNANGGTYIYLAIA